MAINQALRFSLTKPDGYTERAYQTIFVYSKPTGKLLYGIDPFNQSVFTFSRKLRLLLFSLDGGNYK